MWIIDLKKKNGFSDEEMFLVMFSLCFSFLTTAKRNRKRKTRFGPCPVWVGPNALFSKVSAALHWPHFDLFPQYSPIFNYWKIPNFRVFNWTDTWPLVFTVFVCVFQVSVDLPVRVCPGFSVQLESFSNWSDDFWPSRFSFISVYLVFPSFLLRHHSGRDSINCILWLIFLI